MTSSKQPLKLDWLIVGGGVHGVHMAARLLAEGKATPASLRIVDPEPLLGRWRWCTENTGMTYLRSPSVHHVDIDPLSLWNYAVGKKRKRPRGMFTPPYNRPALTLFNLHAELVIKTWELESLHIRASAGSAEIRGSTVAVRTETGALLEAKHAVLALGSSSQPAWPSWALSRRGAGLSHVFDRAAPVPQPSELGNHIAVVGGGISAGQLALRLATHGKTVTLLSRHALRKHQFDSDPGWLGPKHMSRFWREPCWQIRRAMIQAARHRGSMPEDVIFALNHARRRGAIRWQTATVQAVGEGSRPELLLDKGTQLEVDHVALATGFSSNRPGGKLVDDLIASAELPCAPCGYPQVDRRLRWHPHLSVMGPLAELELGPTARNIAGARAAAERIAQCSIG